WSSTSRTSGSPRGTNWTSLRRRTVYLHAFGLPPPGKPWRSSSWGAGVGQCPWTNSQRRTWMRTSSTVWKFWWARDRARTSSPTRRRLAVPSNSVCGTP
ncbi:MAG: hypothetical protein AVDCRST_MAG80-1411, partial [uncultured Rubrobacteraceae bacterium]